MPYNCSRDPIQVGKGLAITALRTFVDLRKGGRDIREPAMAMAMQAEWMSCKANASKDAVGRRAPSDGATRRRSRRTAASGLAAEGKYSCNGHRSASQAVSCANRDAGKRSVGRPQGTRPGRNASRCFATENLSEIAVLVNSCGGKVSHTTTQTTIAARGC